MPAGLPFSPGILAGDTLYISGKGDHLPDGKHPATFEEQVRQAMRNVETTLKQAGLDFRHVVMSHVFLDDPENLAAMDRVYKEFVKEGDEPACATVLVDWIPGGSHIEVTCIATTDLAGRKAVRPAGIACGPAVGAVTASPAVWAGDILYLSALSGYKQARGGLASDLGEQVHQMAHGHLKRPGDAGPKAQRSKKCRREAEIFLHEEGTDDAGQSRNAVGHVDHERRQIGEAHLAPEFQDVAIDPAIEGGEHEAGGLGNLRRVALLEQVAKIFLHLLSRPVNPVAMAG